MKRTIPLNTPKKFQLTTEVLAPDRGYSFAELWHQFEQSRRNNLGTARANARGTTLSSYWKDIEPYFAFLQGRGYSHWNEVDEQDTVEWVSQVTHRVSARTGQRLSKATLMHNWRSLKALMRFIERDPNCRRKGMRGHLSAIPNISVKYRDENEVYKLPSPQEVKRFLAAMNQELLWDKRDWVMSMLILDCGVRIGELCFSRLEHLKRLRQGLLDVQGKRGKRTVNITPNRVEMLEEWLRTRAQQQLAHDYTFFTKNSTPMLKENQFDGSLEPDHSAIDQAFQRHSARSGVKMTPYMLRHYFATHFLVRGGSLAELRQMLGHAGYDVLVIYEHMATQYTHLAEAQAKYSPAEQLDQMSDTPKKKPKSTRQGKKRLLEAPISASRR